MSDTGTDRKNPHVAKHRISPVTAIACVALFFSLAGVGLAASRYVITSTNQIKPNVLHALRGQRGPRGLAGPPGPAGASGPAGTPQLTIAQDSGVISGPAGFPGFAQVLCPGTLVALSGGYQSDVSDHIIVDSAYPLPGNIGWYFDAHSTNDNAHVLTVYVVCTTAATGG